MGQPTWYDAEGVWEGTSLVVMARLEDINKALVTQASTSTITYVVTHTGGTAITSQTSLTVANVIFDTPQTKATDPRWTREDGYNFRYTHPPTDFPTGGVRVEIGYKITDTGGNVTKFGVRLSTTEEYHD